MKHAWLFGIVAMALCIIQHDAQSHRTNLFLSYTSENGRHYLTIPAAVFGKEMLLVTRITGNAFDYDVNGAGHYLTKLGTLPFVFTFEEQDSQIVLRYIRPDISSNYESEIASAVKANNLAPIVHVFDITSKNANDGSVCIDISHFFGDTDLGWGNLPSKFAVAEMDGRRSFLRSVRHSENKLELTRLVTYRVPNVPSNSTNALTVELTHSIILLPKDPMLPRLDVGRSGFNTIERLDAQTHNPKRPNRYIRRWRLTPDSSQCCGDGPVVPEEPITFYIDPSIPKKWRPFVRLGIEDWNKAFEQAGFKKALRVVQIHEAKHDWQTPEMRAVVRYVPGSRVALASTVHDPRTGEILECSIQFGQNKIETMSDRFFVQTAASNPAVRGGVPDDVKGQLIRNLLSHEVGHALGLSHHRGASKAYPVDSLRSVTFTSTHGLSASIMDYTCGNYVAQPEDSVRNFFGGIGELDYWSIVYGYSPLEGIERPTDELSHLNMWNRDKEFSFEQESPIDVDFELGDKSLLSATLGLRNLKIVMDNLIEWSDCDVIKEDELYQRVFEHYEMLMYSVFSKIEGGDWDSTSDEVERLQAFLIDEVFEIPAWLATVSPEERNHERVWKIQTFQEDLLRRLVVHVFAYRVKIGQGVRVFSLLSSLKERLFVRPISDRPIDVCTRNLQDVFVTLMVSIYRNEIDERLRSSDYAGVSMSILRSLQSSIGNNIDTRDGSLSSLHLTALRHRIDDVLGL